MLTVVRPQIVLLEKEIERVVKNTVGLYGDMQGIIGGQIPVIPALELDEEETK